MQRCEHWHFSPDDATECASCGSALLVAFAPGAGVSVGATTQPHAPVPWGSPAPSPSPAPGPPAAWTPPAPTHGWAQPAHGASGASGGWSAPTAPGREAQAYRSPAFLGALLQVLLVGCVLAAGVVLAVTIVEFQLRDHRVDEPGSVSAQQIDRIEDRVLVLSGVQAVGYFVTGIVFVVWLLRICRNARALGARNLRYGAGWVVFGWLIPVFNLFRPKQIVNDAWRASDPAIPPGAAGVWPRVSPWVHVWWGAFLFPNVAVLGVLWNGGIHPEDLRSQAQWAAFGQAALVVAAVLALRLVAELTRRQQLRAAQVRGGEATASQPRAIAPAWVRWLVPVVGVAAVAAGWAVLHEEPEASADVGRPTDRRRTVFVTDVAVGHCFDFLTQQRTVSTVEVFPCDQLHEYEVFAVVHLGDGPYPGDDEVYDLAFEECLPSFEQYVGRPWDVSELDIDSLSPVRDGWTAGDRSAACLAYRIDGKPQKGSVRGSGL